MNREEALSELRHAVTVTAEQLADSPYRAWLYGEELAEMRECLRVAEADLRTLDLTRIGRTSGALTRASRALDLAIRADGAAMEAL